MTNIKHYVGVISPKHESGPVSLQEFDENHNPVGPLFRPADDLVLVSKQVEIVRRINQRMVRLPDVLMSKIEKPDSFRPVIGLHMKVFEPHANFEDYDEDTILYNLKTHNMRFQRFTKKTVFEDVYVEISQDEDVNNQPTLESFDDGADRLAYSIRMCSSHFDALLGQIETSYKCSITLTLDRPTGVYIATWREPAKIYDHFVASRKQDGTRYDESIPMFGIASAIELRVSTFPDAQSIKKVYWRYTDTKILDAVEVQDENTQADEDLLGIQKQLELVSGNARLTRPDDARMVKILLTLILIMLLLIAIRI